MLLPPTTALLLVVVVVRGFRLVGAKSVGAEVVSLADPSVSLRRLSNRWIVFSRSFWLPW